MVEWFLLDRVDTEAAGAAISGQDHLSACAGADEAQTALTIAQLAQARAQIALQTPIIQGMPVASRNADWFISHDVFIEIDLKRGRAPLVKFIQSVYF